MAPELDAAHPTMFVARPYPSGGALYELECYVVVQRCDGADPGLYHYDPGEHALELVRLGSAQVDALAAREAMGAGVRADQIQLLLLITARMHRIAWKYASLAYALVLKHVGVLIDTMYLAATAMELAPSSSSLRIASSYCWAVRDAGAKRTRTLMTGSSVSSAAVRTRS
jgi:SagB-type dehydrogenase family enzyme